MGAINYGCSDIINIGINPAVYDDIDKQDREFYERDDFTDVEYIVQKYEFCHFKVNAKPGYYEGFYLEIEDPEYMYFDDKAEKREFIKELTQLKRLLLELASWGMVQYSPGWCMAYSTERETVLAIRAAIRAAKAKAEKMPCYRTYKRRSSK